MKCHVHDGKKSIDIHTKTRETLFYDIDFNLELHRCFRVVKAHQNVWIHLELLREREREDKHNMGTP